MVAAYRQPRRQNLNIQERLKLGLVAYYSTAQQGVVNLKAGLWGVGATPGILDLTNNGTVTRAAGPSNNLPDASHYVAASSQFLSVADSVYLQPRASVFAFAIWAKPDGVATASTRMAMAKRAANNIEWSLYHNGSTNIWSFEASSSGTAATRTVLSAIAAPTGSWYFVTGWWDGAALTLRTYFPDGSVEQVRSAAFAGPVFAGTAPFTISNNQVSTFRWSGDLSNAYYWIGRIPKRSELDWLYNEGAGNVLVPLV